MWLFSDRERDTTGAKGGLTLPGLLTLMAPVPVEFWASEAAYMADKGSRSAPRVADGR